MKNKYDLVNKVYDEYQTNGAMKKQLVPVVEAVFDAISEMVADGETVSIVGFGQFAPYVRSAHMGKHPQTGEPMEVAEVHSIKFKPSSSIKNRIKVVEEIRNEK